MYFLFVLIGRGCHGRSFRDVYSDWTPDRLYLQSPLKKWIEEIAKTK